MAEERRIVMVAGVGVNVDFIARRIHELGSGAIGKVMLVGLETGDPGESARVAQARELLLNYLHSLGINNTFVTVSAGQGIVREVKRVILEARREAEKLRAGIVEVFLGGGPKALTAAMTIAAIIVEAEAYYEREARRIASRLVIQGEGLEKPLVIDVSVLYRLLSLDELSWSIVRELLTERSVKELLKKLRIPKSTLYKKLNELKSKGLIEPSPRGRGYWGLSSQAGMLLN